MKTLKIIQFQGVNKNWFIKKNGELICGACSKEWSDKFLKLITEESKIKEKPEIKTLEANGFSFETGV